MANYYNTPGLVANAPVSNRVADQPHMQPQMPNIALNVGEQGQPALAFSKPSNTSYATIISTVTVGYRAIKHIIAAGNGTSGNASIAINNGSTDYEIATAIPVGINDSHVWTFDPPLDLPASHSLKVKTSSANNITFSANYRYIPR